MKSDTVTVLVCIFEFFIVMLVIAMVGKANFDAIDKIEAGYARFCESHGLLYGTSYTDGIRFYCRNDTELIGYVINGDFYLEKGRYKIERMVK